MLIGEYKRQIEYIRRKTKQSGQDINSNYFEEQIVSAARVGSLDDNLSSYQNSFSESFNLYRFFRRGYNLDPAKFPKLKGMIEIWVLVFIIIVIETGINGTFYAQASPSGLIGGWIIAALVSVVVYALSYVGGLSLRIKNELTEVKVSSDSESDRNRSAARGVKGSEGTGWFGGLKRILAPIVALTFSIVLGFIAFYISESLFELARFSSATIAIATFFVTMIIYATVSIVFTSDSSNDEHISKAETHIRYESRYDQKLLGWILFGLLAVLVTCFIFFIGIYRDEAVQQDAGVSELILMNLTYDRFSTFEWMPRADINGFILLLANFFICAYVIFKGYTDWETIPDHRVKALNLKKSRIEYKLRIEFVRDQIKKGSNPDSGVAEIKMPDVLSLIGNYERLYEEDCNLHQRFNSLIDVSKENLANKINIYRNLNKEHRLELQKEQLPKWYESAPLSNPKLSIDSAVSGEEDKLSTVDEQEDLVDRLVRHRERAIELIAASQQKKIEHALAQYEKEPDNKLIEMPREDYEEEWREEKEDQFEIWQQ